MHPGHYNYINFSVCIIVLLTYYIHVLEQCTIIINNMSYNLSDSVVSVMCIVQSLFSLMSRIVLSQHQPFVPTHHPESTCKNKQQQQSLSCYYTHTQTMHVRVATEP